MSREEFEMMKSLATDMFNNNEELAIEVANMIFSLRDGEEIEWVGSDLEEEK